MHLKTHCDIYSFAVVIPFYNQKEPLKSCLESVAFQERLPDEVVIIDDNSACDISDLVERYSDRFEIKYHKLSKNSGPSVARNVGVDIANSDFILFLDADDRWKSNHVKNISKFVGSREISFCAASYFYQSESTLISSSLLFSDKTFLKVDDLFELLSGIKLPFVTSSVCISKNLFKSLGGFNKDLTLGEDQELWLRVWAGVDLFVLPEPTVEYVVDSPSSLTKITRSEDIVLFLDAIIKLHSTKVKKSIALSYERYVARNFFRACISACFEGYGQYVNLFGSRGRFFVNKFISYRLVLFLLYIAPSTIRFFFAMGLLRVVRFMRLRGC